MGLAQRIRESLNGLTTPTGLPIVFGGTVEAGRRIRLGNVRGSKVGALEGLLLESGFGLGGRVLALGRPLTVPDYITSHHIRHRYDRLIEAEQLHAMVAVPVVVTGECVAVLYAASHRVERFGGVILETMASTARELGQRLAVDVALSKRKEHALALAEVSRTAILQDVHTELMALAEDVQDSSVRAQVLATHERLMGNPQPAIPLLTPRQLEILSLVAAGNSNLDIGEELGLTLNTVKSYLKLSMSKLDARNRYEAVVAARRLRFLP